MDYSDNGSINSSQSSVLLLDTASIMDTNEDLMVRGIESEEDIFNESGDNQNNHSLSRVVSQIREHIRRSPFPSFNDLREEGEQDIEDEGNCLATLAVFELYWVLACLIEVALSKDIDCKLPLRDWVEMFGLIQLALLFLHIIGSLWIISRWMHIPIKYKLIIFLLEGVEVYWYVKGNILYFTEDQSTCTEKSHFISVFTFIALFYGYIIILKWIIDLLVFIFLLLILLVMPEETPPMSASEVLEKLVELEYDPLIFSRNKDCVICFEVFQGTDKVIIMPCDPRHYFHSRCIRAWFTHKISCPVCNQTITKNIIRKMKNTKEILAFLEKHPSDSILDYHSIIEDNQQGIRNSSFRSLSVKRKSWFGKFRENYIKNSRLDMSSCSVRGENINLELQELNHSA